MKTDRNIIIKNKGEIVSGKMILLFFSLSISMVIIFMFLIPQYEQMKIKEMEIELTTETLESKKDIFIKITSFNKTYEDISETELNKMSDLLPDDNNFEEHLASIDKLAKKNGILVKGISFSENKKQGSPIVNKNNLEITTVSFSIKSNFLNFMSFLDSLEKSIPLANINRIAIAKEDEKNDNSEDIIINENIGSEIELSFYHL